MVALFLGLKLRLLAGMLKRSVWQLVGVILGVLYGVSMAVFLGIGLAALRFAPHTQLAFVSSIIAVGALIGGIAHILLPILFGADDSMAPQRFALYGLAPKRLAFGLGSAAFVSPVALAEVIAVAGYVVASSRSILTGVVGVICALTILIMFVLSSRIVVALGQELLAGRRAKETITLIGFMLIMLVGVGASALSRVFTGMREPLQQLEAIGNIAAWTPWGATLALPFQLAQGQLMRAIFSGLLMAVSIAVLIVVWTAVVRRTTLRPLPSSSGFSERKGLGEFKRAETTPKAVIVTRVSVYWRRDNRYRVSLVALILVPVTFGALGALNGIQPAYVAVAMCLSAVFFVSFAAANDLAYDNTAFGRHVLAGVRGRADVLARLRLPSIICLALCVIGPVLVVLFDQSALAWLMFTASVGAAGAGIGASAFLMVLLPYAVVPPGGNPMKSPKGSSIVALIAQSVVMGIVIIALLPRAIGLLIGGGNGVASAALVGGGISCCLGVACWALGAHFAPKIYDRRQLAIFKTIEKFANAE